MLKMFQKLSMLQPMLQKCYNFKNPHKPSKYACLIKNVTCYRSSLKVILSFRELPRALDFMNPHTDEGQA